MYINMNDNQIIDIGIIVKDLKELLDNVKERFSNVSLKKENAIDNIVKKYSQNNDFLNKLEIIKSLSDKLLDKLEPLKDFHEEFIAFLSIQNMIEYIIGDIRKYILFSSFIHELISSFYKIINIKIDSMKNTKIHNYEKFFKSYEEKLFKQEEFFYLNIYENTHKYDDLIADVTNILW